MRRIRGPIGIALLLIGIFACPPLEAPEPGYDYRCKCYWGSFSETLSYCGLNPSDARNEAVAFCQRDEVELDRVDAAGTCTGCDECSRGLEDYKCQ